MAGIAAGSVCGSVGRPDALGREHSKAVIEPSGIDKEYTCASRRNTGDLAWLGIKSKRSSRPRRNILKLAHPLAVGAVSGD